MWVGTAVCGVWGVVEAWMWRLIGSPDLARSPPLKTFLEFERALTRAQQQRWVGTGEGGKYLGNVLEDVGIGQVPTQ
jgi:hypothetical protein